MTKTLTETQITTARARSKLGLGVHWRRVDAEAHLGYRKGKRSGIWFVRWRNHYDGANYKQAAVGTANDVNDKVMEGKLTFEKPLPRRGTSSVGTELKRPRKLPDRHPPCERQWRHTSGSVMPATVVGLVAKFDPMRVTACGAMFLVKESVAAREPWRRPPSPQSLCTHCKLPTS